MRSLLAVMLGEAGYEVTEVKNGAEALFETAIDTKKPLLAAFDLLVTDFHMPGATGMEVVEGLRGSKVDTKVLIITALPTSEICVQAQSLGARVLAKPFAMTKFMQTVDEITKSDTASTNSP